LSDKKKNQKHNKSIESAHITIENTQEFSAANSTRKFNLYIGGLGGSESKSGKHAHVVKKAFSFH
jgi:phosphoribosylcarboxyaminoimidazole (NCAIR) mutase